MITFLGIDQKFKPHPLTQAEQKKLFDELAPHLRIMADFGVNTGCRDAEMCNLQWQWEIKIDCLNASIFVIPEQYVKNGDERLVILNKIAQVVVDQQRGIHPTHVFTYRGKPIKRMLNSGWKRARKVIGLPHFRVHDLKHTFGSRLRASDVRFEDRQELLGHVCSETTTLYSAANLAVLIEFSNRVCDVPEEKEEIVIIKRR